MSAHPNMVTVKNCHTMTPKNHNAGNQVQVSYLAVARATG